MPGMKPRKVPSLRRHKTGQAVVTLPLPGGKRRDVYLGKFGTAKSVAEYNRIVAELSAGASVPEVTGTPVSAITVNEMLVRYMVHADDHYRDADRERTGEYDNVRLAARALKELYGHTLAKEFGPRSLKAIQQHLVGGNLARTEINRRVRRIRRIFKWAESEELIPASVHQALTTVSPLAWGRSKARETEPVQPVPESVVLATLPYVSRFIGGMIRLQLVTGMRPGEVIRMRLCDIDATGEVWIYRPKKHKTRHRGKERVVAIGKRGQEVIKEFASGDVSAYLFSPAKAREERYAAMRAKRRTKVQPSQVYRRKELPKRTPGARYTPESYAQAVAKGIKRANKKRAADTTAATTEPLAHWHPNQLRHTFGTAVRRQFGVEGAQVTLGHSKADVTQVYAERDLSLAEKIASAIG